VNIKDLEKKAYLTGTILSVDEFGVSCEDQLYFIWYFSSGEYKILLKTISTNINYVKESIDKIKNMFENDYGIGYIDLKNHSCKLMKKDWHL